MEGACSNYFFDGMCYLNLKENALMHHGFDGFAFLFSLLILLFLK